MKTTGLAGLILVMVCVLPGAVPPPTQNTTIALISRVILDVTRKQPDKAWQAAKRGEMLSSGERLKTGEKSIAVIKFKDNSMLRVREKTEVLLNGVKDGTSTLKSTEFERGVIGFSIKKQQQGEGFRFSSPTSVASVRGTSGQFSASDSLDKLIVLDGLVALSSKVSSRVADVGGGFTGLSYPDGTLQVRPSTPEEKVAAELSSRTGEQDGRLDIELKDGGGNKKNIEIKFR